MTTVTEPQDNTPNVRRMFDQILEIFSGQPTQDVFDTMLNVTARVHQAHGRIDNIPLEHVLEYVDLHCENIKIAIKNNWHVK